MPFEKNIFLPTLCLFLTVTGAAQAVADSNFTGTVDVGIPETTTITNNASTFDTSSFLLSTIMSVVQTFTVQNNSTISPSSLSTPIAVQMSTANMSLVVPTSSQLETSFLFLLPNATQYLSETPTSAVAMATSPIVPPFSVVSSSYVPDTFASPSLSSIPASSPALSPLSSSSSALTLASNSPTSIYVSGNMQTSLPFLSTTAHLSSAMSLTSMTMPLATSLLTDNITQTSSTYAVLLTASSSSTVPMSSVSYVHASISPTSSTDNTSLITMSPVLSTAFFASSVALNSSSKSLIMSEVTSAFVATSSTIAPSILHSSSEVTNISPLVNSSLLTTTIVPTSPTLLSPIDTISSSIVVHMTPVLTSSLLTTITNASLSHTLTSSVSYVHESISPTSSTDNTSLITMSPVLSTAFFASSVALNSSSKSLIMSEVTSAFVATSSTIAPSILHSSSEVTNISPLVNSSLLTTTIVPTSPTLLSPIDTISSSIVVHMTPVITSSLLTTITNASLSHTLTSSVVSSSIVSNLSNITTASLIYAPIESTLDFKYSIIATSYLINSTVLHSEAVSVGTDLSMVLSPSASSVSHLSLKSDVTSSEFHTLSLVTTHSDVISSYNPPSGIELSSTDTPSLIIATSSQTSSIYLDSSLFSYSYLSKSSVIATDTMHASVSMSVSSTSLYSVVHSVVTPSAVSSLLGVSSSTIVNVPINSVFTPSVFSSDIVTRAIQSSSVSTLATEVTIPSASTLSSFALSSLNVTSLNVSTSSAVTSQHWYSSSIAQTIFFPSTTQTSSILTSLTHTSSFVMTTPNSTLLSSVATTIAPASYASSLFDIVSTFPSTTLAPTDSVIQTFSNTSTSVVPTPSNIFTSTNVSSNWISIVPTSSIGMTSAAVNTTIVSTMSLSSSLITRSQLGYTSTLLLSPSTTSTMTILSDVPTIISTETTVNHTYIPTTPSVPMTTSAMTSRSTIFNTSLPGYTSTLNAFASTTTTLISLSVVPTINSSEMTFMHTFASTGSSIQISMVTTTLISPIANISLDLTTPSVSSSFVQRISDTTPSTGLDFTLSLHSFSLSAMETSMFVVPTPSVNSSILIRTTDFQTPSKQTNTVETTYTNRTTSILQTSVVASSIEPTSSVFIKPTDLLSSTVTVIYSTSPTSESITPSSPSSTSTTAAPPTIQVKLMFSINETWNPYLADTSSQQYVALKTNVEKELTAAWQRSTFKRYFIRVGSILFRSGSVVIDSVLEFNEGQGQTFTADVVVKSFIDAVNGTQLGNLTIINNTVTAEIVSTKTEAEPTSTAQLPNWGIAVIVCGGAVLIFLLTLICILCRRRHVTHKYALTEDPDDIGYRRSWATNGVEYSPYVYDNKLALNDEDLAEQVEIKNAAVVVTPYVEDTNERRHIKSALPDPFIDTSSHYPDWPPVNGLAKKAARDHYDNTRTFYDQETDTWETPM